MWTDAICIDQTSVVDKNQQVPLMGDIYRKAHEVVIWLGDIDAVSAIHVFMLSVLGKSSLSVMEAETQWTYQP
jgi:hypothetical protein